MPNLLLLPEICEQAGYRLVRGRISASRSEAAEGDAGATGMRGNQNALGLPESKRLNKRAGNPKEGTDGKEKAQPELSSIG